MEKLGVIGIIGAMDVEVEGIIAQMTDVKRTKLGGSTFYSGVIGGRSVVAVQSGIGKVNASFVASALALKFGAESILMTGVCGGVGLAPLVPVVPDGFVQHDVDMIGEAKGHIDVVDEIVIKPDSELSSLLAQASDGVRGIMATGEQFIGSPLQIDAILADFPNVIAVDMESGAVAQVCARLGVKFACIKIISDGGDENAYYDFKTEASNKSISSVLKVLNEKPL
ncbi:MAG: 5'-methylthioadenosine/S-adenosylhomocysteine nucleosidase [Clostridia bacterium]|nr:5'-methylthioadenosine/S-adenosylhomocysteine nucleosidase [Clostridia bacterium]